MKLYAGTTEQFRTDAQLHRIADKLRAVPTAVRFSTRLTGTGR